jgi:hypothetical protein
MSGAKSPLQVVNEQHGGKDKLVDKLVGLIERGEMEADELKQKLRSVSNAKLLRLLAISETVKEKYGSKDKLVAAVAQALGRAKDADFVKRLGSASVGKLVDMAQSLARKAKMVPGPEAKGAAKAKAAKTEKPAKGEKVAAAGKTTKAAGEKKTAAKKTTATKSSKSKK